MQVLLDAGADVNQKEPGYNRTALHLAAQRGQTEVVRLLLDRGADISARENDNETPLYYATGGGSLETVKLLVERGLKVEDGQSKVEDATPLLYAVQRGHAEVARYLIEKGANPLWRNSRGGTLLHEAVMAHNAELTELFLSKGLSPNDDPNGFLAPLEIAVAWGFPDLAKLLVERGADVNQRGDTGLTPLLSAIQNGGTETALFLIANGARVGDTMKEAGETPLHLAALRGYGEVVSALIEKGADVNAVDSRGATPLDRAVAYGQKRSAEILVAKGGQARLKESSSDTAALLGKKLKDGEAVVWYLGHSGWAIKTAGRLLVFDYWDRPGPPDNPGLANGRIDPAEIKDLKVTFFSSHEHGDHYAPAIFDWKNAIPGATVVMGFKPQGKDGYVLMAPRERQTIEGMEIVTIASNDSGVGFFVRVDGLNIFHPGDHANRALDFSQPFKEEIDFLADAGLKADIFFAPVVGCQLRMPPEAVRKGAEYAFERLSPKAVFPMHGYNHEDGYVTFAKAAKDEGVRAPMPCAANCGDVFLYANGNVVKENGKKS